ncbi:hypothetical protein [Plasmodium yoelii yoelii]|uniref:Uncharacterized protein n=1 Tax=Plasmodium yoelii yoelii TaxID=73239 RepID=Q7RCM7_PLAYO|nr:hypothetical protein [Plasmodium yoelii yoelii]
MYNYVFFFFFVCANTRILEDFHWKPVGENVPDISSINLSRKKAWDIGKEETFLTVYSHSYQETIKGINPSVLKIFR